MIKMHKTTYSDVVFSPEDLIVVARISLQTAYKIIKELYYFSCKNLEKIF